MWDATHQLQDFGIFYLVGNLPVGKMKVFCFRASCFIALIWTYRPLKAKPLFTIPSFSLDWHFYVIESDNFWILDSRSEKFQFTFKMTGLKMKLTLLNLHWIRNLRFQKIVF